MKLFLKFLNPNLFLKYSLRLRLLILIKSLFLFCSGFYLVLNSPCDYQQDILVKIMYIHVPAAWLSLMIYTIMGLCGISCIIWGAKFAFYLCLASAPIGTCFTLITLATGMIWGKPIWGTWWVWDARLTSMLIVLIFYIVFLMIAGASKNIHKIEKPASIIAIIGLINIPIVKFSVDLWYSLHQPASIIRLGGPAIETSMLIPLITMFFAHLTLYLYLLLIRVDKLIKKYGIRSN
ncbi:MAG: heme ABC transporter permease CcmC [Rickettsiaceae bacterium]|nr:heme ABC transporter permease CcmC [Rickettsiaceae bacterium]